MRNPNKLFSNKLAHDHPQFELGYTTKYNKEIYKQQLAATNKKSYQKIGPCQSYYIAHKNRNVFAPNCQIITQKNDIKDTNEDAKPSAKKKEIIAADQLLAYLPLLQNLAVMMKDGNN